MKTPSHPSGRKRRLPGLFTAVFALPLGGHAEARNPLYSIPGSVVDGGGRPGGSSHYSNSGSLASPAGTGSSASYGLSSGFPAQLGEPINQAPADLALGSTSIAENAAVGSVVGSFLTSDPDAAGTFAYSLTSGPGDTDNSVFAIAGSDLTIHVTPDFESKSVYSIRVRTTDQGGLFFEKEFTITITDVNEAPVASPATYARAVGTSFGINIASLLAASTSDPEGDTRTLQSVGASAQGASISQTGTSILYSPANNNADSFIYTIDDGHGNTASSTISVIAVNPAGANLAFARNPQGQGVPQFAGIPGYPYSIERTTDLRVWTVMQTLNAPASGVFSITDPTQPPAPKTFYRMSYTPAP